MQKITPEATQTQEQDQKSGADMLMAEFITEAVTLFARAGIISEAAAAFILAPIELNRQPATTPPPPPPTVGPREEVERLKTAEAFRKMDAMLTALSPSPSPTASNSRGRDPVTKRFLPSNGHTPCQATVERKRRRIKARERKRNSATACGGECECTCGHDQNPECCRNR